MFRNLAKYVILVIALAIVLITFFLTLTNEAITDEFNGVLKVSRAKFLNQYVAGTYQVMEEVIISNARWSEGLSRFNSQDSEWLKSNAIDYVVDDLNYDQVMVIDDQMDYVLKVGEIPLSLENQEVVERILETRMLQKETIYYNHRWYLIIGLPFADEEDNNKTGAYVIVKDLTMDMPLLETILKLDDEMIVNLSDTPLEGEFSTVLEYKIPNYTGERVVYVGLDMSSMTRIISSQRDYSIVIVMIIAFVVLSAMVYVFHIGDEKMQQITRDITRITGGNYAIRIPVKKNVLLPEIEILSESINHMSEEVENHIQQIDERYAEMVNVLVDVVEMKDQYTYHHSVAVSEYALMVGKAIGYHDLANLELAAKLHDVGKLSISSEILNKPSRLNDEEYEIIKTHSAKGYELLSDIEYFKDAREAILYHHERYDGNGYPFGLAGEEIPIMAQIITIADAFDAMTSDRAYRKALPVEQAIRNLMKDSGTMFNPQLVEAFVKEFTKGYKIMNES